MDIAGFTGRRIATGETEIFARVGGSGPPLVCLHGYPQTHVTWRKVAPALAERYTVVLIDSRGYGDSAVVPSGPDHAAYGKRAMARDVAAVMSALGHERFFVAGHDRGARVGYRLALDAPERVAAFASLDVIPTVDTFEAMNEVGAYRAYHWYFLAQPAPLPERLIASDPDFYARTTIESWLEDPAAVEPEAMEAYLAWFRRPSSAHVVCEDYRAGYTVDLATDRADRAAGRKLVCPVFVLWGAGPSRPRTQDFVGVWQRWADDVSGHGLPCGHFLMEEQPAATSAALLAFFAQHRAALP
jgi:haloacetate dehalogenase